MNCSPKILALALLTSGLTASLSAEESPSPSPSETVSPPARSIRVSFVPPPLDGTISLGIYDAKGALVRVLFREADINDARAMSSACRGADYVLHQAAIASVPRSVREPELSNHANVDGTLALLMAARGAGLRTSGVLCGGFSAEDLRAAGAIEVYRDVADLLDRYDDSMIAREISSGPRSG